MPTIYTVKAECLTGEADQLERDAKQSLNAWVLIGQSERYGIAMQTVRMLRAAAAEKSICARREILRNAGYTIKSARTLIDA